MERTIRTNQDGGVVRLQSILTLLIVTAALSIGGCDATPDNQPRPSVSVYIPTLGKTKQGQLLDSIRLLDSAQLRQDSIMCRLREHNPKWQNREKLRRGMTMGEVEKLMGSEWELYTRRRASQFYAGQCYEELCRWRLDSLQDMELTFFTCDGKDSSDRVLFSEARVVMR
jgi:hypothetical protein